MNPIQPNRGYTNATWMLVGFLFFLSACAGSYGKIMADPAVESVFNSQTAGSAYRFYYDGRENTPNAVIGIESTFSFTSRFWTAVEPGTLRYKALINRVFRTDGEAVTAGWILAPDGRRIGIWYSPYRRTVVKVNPDKTVVVLSPYMPTRRLGIDRDPL